jgi:predicted transcriptional regulator
MMPHNSFPVEPSTTNNHYVVPFNQIFRFITNLLEPHPENISDMIKQSPTGIQRLMDNMEILESEIEVTKRLTGQQPICLASNGGAYLGKASYSWILQIGDSPVAKENGPVYGNDPRSFHAKG